MIGKIHITVEKRKHKREGKKKKERLKTVDVYPIGSGEDTQVDFVS